MKRSIKQFDLGDDAERLEWLNNYFGEQYTSWSQISWSQMKWFLVTLRLNKDLEQEHLLSVARFGNTMIEDVVPVPYKGYEVGKESFEKFVEALKAVEDFI